MKVAHVIEAMYTGGAESMVLEHVRRAASDVHCTVVALNRGGPALAQVERSGADTLVLGKGRARMGAVLRLARELRSRHVDVVNAHNPVGAFYGTLAARLAGVPVVVRTEHSIHYPGRGGALYATLERWITGANDRVICVCEASRASLAPRAGHLASRFVTVYNGISEAGPRAGRDRVRDSLGLRPGECMALTVGSLTPQKSHDLLLEAFAHTVRACPGARLFVAGEGPLRDSTLALRSRLGLEREVTLLGARLDVGDLMTACDVFVLSSSREGLSVTLLEALRAGRPAVATAIGGNPEVVEDGTCGRIVPFGEPPALGEALASLLSDPAACEVMGTAARRRWERCFTAERMVRETERIYASLLAAHRGERRSGA